MTGVLLADGEQPRVGAASRPVTDVAVGILIDPTGQYLLTSRPAGKAYAGYWEFPGGKVEPGETVEQALVRELHEELGVTVASPERWREQVVDYPHALVRLHFCRVRAWTGTPQMREGQSSVWTRLPPVVQPILPGTVPVLAWLADDAPV